MRRILNIVFEFLKTGKALGLFKRGRTVDDLTPRRRDKRDRYRRD